VYTAQSEGHANRYQLFLERSMALAKPGGRVGMVLPAGLVSDHGSAALRRQLFGQCDVDALVLRQSAGHLSDSSQRAISAVTASRGTPTRTIACRFGEHNQVARRGWRRNGRCLAVVHRAPHAGIAAAGVRRRSVNSGRA
jgi:hypothetical protein